MILDDYFNFEKFYETEIENNIEDYIDWIEDGDIKLDCLTKQEAIGYLKNPPFPLFLDECQINFEKQTIIIDFSEEYDNSTESGYDVSYCRFYIEYSIKDECIISLGSEQG